MTKRQPTFIVNHSRSCMRSRCPRTRQTGHRGGAGVMQDVSRCTHDSRRVPLGLLRLTGKPPANRHTFDHRGRPQTSKSRGDDMERIDRPPILDGGDGHFRWLRFHRLLRPSLCHGRRHRAIGHCQHPNRHRTNCILAHGISLRCCQVMSRSCS
jgi:hypothetical protein